MKMARLGLLFDRDVAEKRWLSGQNVFEVFLFEVLDHLRIPYEKVDFHDSLQDYDVVITGLIRDHRDAADKLLDYVSAGGTLISYGGLDCLTATLDVAKVPIPQAGYAFLADFLSQDLPPLRFLDAEPWEPKSIQTAFLQKGLLSETNANADGAQSAVLQKIKYGKGRIERWSVPVPKTILGLQQGTAPVTEDGIPAPDGTANLDENLLKADDGFELDWVMDRTLTETGMPYFQHPYADLWKEAIIEHLFTCAGEKGLTLPFIDNWPENIEHVAMISHDSDLNVDESALITLETLEKEGVHSTWCMIAPGYSSDIYEKVKEAGHELAMHYNALQQDGGVWSEPAFSEQLDWVKKATGLNEIVSNKNHYTLYEGWGELFSWCEKYGIQADQTRGPSKKGNIGFLFGTCHPYFPVAWADEKNRSYDVVEIGFLTQDLNHDTLADSSVIQPFLDGVKKVRGVAHFLFHQFHILNQPMVREAMVELIRTAKSKDFTFWTCAQINRWERDRRKVSIKGLAGEIEVDGSMNREDLVLLVPMVNAQDGKGGGETVKRFGFPCRKIKTFSKIV
jgi:hypothetical protein